MRVPFTICSTLATIAVLAAAPARLAAQAPALKWGPAPAIFPAGARMAVLQGDPGQSGMFAVRLDMPNGYTIPAHFHPTDEHITVIHGALKVSMGDTMDPAHTMTLPTGGFATAAANMHHSARARGHTVVQVHAMGPFALTYVNPKDDPTHRQK